MSSLAKTKDATLQEKVETLQRQLAEAKSYTASLQATIKETQDALAFTDLDIKRIVTAMLQQQSQD